MASGSVERLRPKPSKMMKSTRTSARRTRGDGHRRGPEEARAGEGSRGGLHRAIIYNGAALQFVANLVREMKSRNLDVPIFVGGKLNRIPDGSNTSLPVDVRSEILETGARSRSIAVITARPDRWSGRSSAETDRQYDSAMSDLENKDENASRTRNLLARGFSIRAGGRPSRDRSGHGGRQGGAVARDESCEGATQPLRRA